MRNFDGNNSWDFRIGETKIFDMEDNISYTLVIGYVNQSLYVRVYDQNDDLVVGTWFDDFIKKGVSYFTSNIVKQCIECVKRMEKLKVFA